jgi:2-methylisocitrate lyase-like PEP mutase family enzyme
LEARQIEDIGFMAIHGSGSVAHQQAGYQDAGLLTMTDMVQRMTVLSECLDIPVIADMDTGFGNVANVVRSVREYERAGVAAFHLEDTVAKVGFAEHSEVEVISRTEMVNKIKAAVDTRTDESMMIIARSENRTDLNEFIERNAECIEAGADGCWTSGALGQEGIQALRKVVSKPFIGVLPRGMSGKDFKAWGVNGAVLPGMLALVALHAQRGLLTHLKNTGSVAGYVEGIEGIEETRKFTSRVGKEEFESTMKRFGGV